jgi:hypothetical protein
MVEERANLDYGLDDRPIDEIADAENADVVLIERTTIVDEPTADDTLTEVNPDANTWGAP